MGEVLVGDFTRVARFFLVKHYKTREKNTTANTNG
jgi:hypothetical protein